jgi:osmotically-inducible protein OsmY
VTTVTTGPDGTVRRTTTRYYYPGTTYTSYTVDDGLIASDVKTALRQDPGVNAHARNIAVASDAGTVEIVGTADSVSTVQQASWDAVQIPGVQQVNNDMRIDPTSPG